MSHLKIYQSSAGSGKTYTLVKEYLLLVLKKPSLLRSTLAVTFTNDATGEMKERVVKALWELSVGKNETLKKDIEASIGNSVDIRKVAGNVLTHILHHYTELSIQTIDSFFLNITKSVAYEAGLPGRYNVDLNRDAAIDFITSELLLSAGDDKELTNWLLDFAYYRMDEKKGWDMQNDIRNISKDLFDDKIQNSLHQLSVDAEQIKPIHAIVNNYKSQLQKMAAGIIDIFESAGITENDIYQKSRGFIKVVKAFCAYDMPKKMIFNSYFMQACEEGRIFDNHINDTELRKDVQERLKEIRNYFEEGKKNYLTAEVILRNIYLKGLLQFLNRQLSVYRKENQVVLISDVGSILRNFISGDDTPFIYEKAGNVYRNFLIDEFQDTSETQWNNMLPLLINSLSQNNQVLTVGDVKQSIYRWRGGDMKLLMTEVKEKLKSHAAKTDVLNLSSNYRSAEAIINFNNILFSSAPEIFIRNGELNPLIEKAFKKEQVIQKVERNDMKGYVRIEKLNKDEELPDYVYPEYCNEQQKIFLGRTLQYIEQQLAKGYSYGDIAILVRENKKGSLLADFLVLNGITQINSRDSLLVTGAPQIRFLISAFSYITDVTNEVAEKHIRWYACKMLGFKSEKLDKIFFDKVKRFQQMALTEAGASLIHLFGLDRSPDGYIQRFEDLLLEKSGKGLWDIQLFLNWWNAEKERMRISVQMPSDNTSVTIMTIHGSKGLQFPIVILPFAEFELTKSQGRIWVETSTQPFDKLGLVPVNVNKTLEETYLNESYREERFEKQLDELNAFYVACTRAEEKLFLLLGEKDSGAFNKVGDIVRFALGNENFLQPVMERKSEKLFTLGEDTKKPLRTKKVSDDPDKFEVDSLKEYLINERGVHKGFKIRKHVSEDDQRTFGIRLHDMMSSYYSADDSKRIIQEIESLPLNDVKKHQLRDDVQRAMNLIEERQWTSSEYRILNETEICDSEGNIIRPDRMMIKDKKAVVLDYKTGQPLNEHQQQMLGYKDVLEKTGFTSVEAFLYYAESGEMLAVG